MNQCTENILYLYHFRGLLVSSVTWSYWLWLSMRRMLQNICQQNIIHKSFAFTSGQNQMLVLRKRVFKSIKSKQTHSKIMYRKILNKLKLYLQCFIVLAKIVFTMFQAKSSLHGIHHIKKAINMNVKCAIRLLIQQQVCTTT